MDADYYNDISDKIQDTARDKYQRVLQSTLLYIIAFIIVAYVNVGVSGLVAKLMGYHPSIRFFGLYDMPMSATQWTRWSILFIFGSGPTAALILAIISYRINVVTREFNTLWKALCLWIAIHGTSLFFSYCITSSLGTGSPYLPFYYGFAVIASWLYVDPVLMAPLSFIGVAGLIIFGLNVIVPFLNLCFSRALAMNHKGKRGFLLQVAVFPWIFGSIATMIISMPPTPSMRELMINLCKNACMAFMMLGISFKTEQMVSSIQVHSYDVFKRSALPVLLVTVVLVLIVQEKWVFEFLHLIGLG